MATVTEKQSRLGLSERVLLGLVLGIIVGILFGEMVSWLEFVGDVFIKLLQITVIPYLSLSLITGLGELSFDEVKRLAFKGGSVLLLLWAIALTIVVLMPLALPAWPSASFFSTSLVEETAKPDFLQLFIPSNPFHSYANAIVPAIVVFSILLGIALIGMQKKAVLLEPLSVFREALMRLTGIVSKLAPIGVFALMAHAVGTTDIADLVRLQVYIVLYSLVALVLGLWVLPALVTALTPLRYNDIVRALHTPLITAFATGSSLIVVPLLIERCKQLIADAKIFSGQAQEDADSSVNVLIPTFYPFPNSGFLMALSFVLFAGWYVGSEVSVANYLILVLGGVPILFGGTTLAVRFSLDQLTLPSDLLELFITVDVVNLRFGTLVAAMHFATIGLLGTIALEGKLRLRWVSLAWFTLISAALIAAVIFGVRAFYTHVVIAPYTKAETLKGLHFLANPQPMTVYDRLPHTLEKSDTNPVSLEEIHKRGVIRFCFQPDEYPSAFYNSENPPQLVGFDIEMAHRFAQRLRLPTEFIAARDQKTAAEMLNAGACDLYMRTLAVTADRTRVFGLTSPIYTSSIGLIVRDHRRDEFRRWEHVYNLGASLRLAVEATPGNLTRVRFLLPKAKVVPMTDLKEQQRILESGGAGVDAIIDMAEEGAAWTLLYPSFSLVVPKPTRFIPVAYATTRGNSTLLEAFDAWLLAEKSNGNVDTLYRYWMLGEAAKAKKKSRWSVVRDVLDWVD